MNHEQMRVAIAKACGWTVKYRKDGIEWTALVSPEAEVIDTTSGRAELSNFGCVPNYLNDLNAMHEAEKVLGAQQKADFRDHLTDILTSEGLTEDDARDASVHATALQRAEALCKTLNLKVEDET